MSVQSSDPSAVPDAFVMAVAAFREAASAEEPLLPFVAGMRAICDGADACVLSDTKRVELAVLVELARPSMIDVAIDHELDEARQKSLYLHVLDRRQTLGHVQQTLGLLMAWGTPLEDRSEWHPGFLTGLCAFIRLQANMLENVILSERAACGVFNQPDPIREQAEGLVLETRSMTDADVSQPRTRH